MRYRSDDPRHSKKVFSQVEECFGKRQYDSWRHAEYDAKQTRRNYGDKTFPYRCRHCKKIHVGSIDIGKAG